MLETREKPQEGSSLSHSALQKTAESMKEIETEYQYFTISHCISGLMGIYTPEVKWEEDCNLTPLTCMRN